MSPFEWHDAWRLVIAIACLVSLMLLERRFVKSQNSWNSKTRDFWFSTVMWTMAGCVGSLQGIFFDYPPGPSLVFTTAAAAVGILGLMKEGNWGGDS